MDPRGSFDHHEHPGYGGLGQYLAGNVKRKLYIFERGSQHRLVCRKNEVGTQRRVESKVRLPNCLRRIWIHKWLWWELRHQEVGSQTKIHGFLVKNILA